MRKSKKVPTVSVDESKPPMTVDLEAVKVDEDVEQETKLDRAKSTLAFEHLREKVARSGMYWRNVSIPLLVKAFPVSRTAQTVDYYFPFAEGGALYVDEPRYQYNIEECRKKAKIFRENKLRYVFLEENDTLETALQKLEGQIK